MEVGEQQVLEFKEESRSRRRRCEEVVGNGNYKLVPWISWDDWKSGNDSLFSSSPPSISSALTRRISPEFAALYTTASKSMTMLTWILGAAPFLAMITVRFLDLGLNIVSKAAMFSPDNLIPRTSL